MTEIGLFSTNLSNTAPSIGGLLQDKIEESPSYTISSHLYTTGRIDQMLARGQVFLDERLLDGLCALRFMDASGRRVHMGEEVGHGGLAGFADMHHVAGPRRVAFVAVARLAIIGRFDPFRGRGQLAVGLEADASDRRGAVGGHLARGPLVVALPGLP